jgi:hypothetical protein
MTIVAPSSSLKVGINPLPYRPSHAGKIFFFFAVALAYSPFPHFVNLQPLFTIT